MPENDYRRFHMKKTCRSDRDNEETRASCQPESGSLLTNHRTNISYSNAHYTICNDDFDASTDHLWPVGYTCNDHVYNIYVASITSRDHHTMDAKLSFWNISQSDSVNRRFPVDVFSFLHFYKWSLGRPFSLILLIKYKSHSNGHFNERKQYYQQGEVNIIQFSGSEYSSYNCTMLPLDIVESIMRRCSYVISTCASDWSDRDLEAMCFSYTDYCCNGTDYFRTLNALSETTWNYLKHRIAYAFVQLVISLQHWLPGIKMFISLNYWILALMLDVSLNYWIPALKLCVSLNYWIPALKLFVSLNYWISFMQVSVDIQGCW